MTNENKNINELVIDDDDPTAELEMLADTFGFEPEPESEADLSIIELQSDLQNRAETIDRLQYDIEQLRARWTGLETEIKAREEITSELNAKLGRTEEQLSRKERLLRKRDQTIKSLKAEIRDRNDEYGALQTTLIGREQQLEALQKAAQNKDTADPGPPTAIDEERLAGQLASATAEAGELRARLERAELYADDLRRQLQDRSGAADANEVARQALEENLDVSNRRAQELENEVSELRASNGSLEERLASIAEVHAEEIRMIRFELGEAQETMAQQELVTEQLASDLVDTRGFKDELEKMLTQTEEDSIERIDNLERENKRLKDELAHSRETLEGKSEAINCLLSELAKKSQQIESIGEIEEVIHDIDDRMSESIEERVEERLHRDRDRVSRVLIGAVDGQELRFPLFKDRLTIGRTEQNDIQLKASYVSRRHAVVVTDHDTTRVIDWGSKNGVFVNGDRVTEHFLNNGDAVRIGTAEFRYEERPKRDI
jgi:chromosome segregation ATPase